MRVLATKMNSLHSQEHLEKKTPSQTVAGIAGGELAGEPQPGADGLPIMGGQSASHPTRPIVLLDTFRPCKNL